MNKNAILMVIFVLLIAISAVQAIQLTSLKAKIDSGTIKTGAASQRTANTGAQGGVENLPTMVGGC